MTNIHKLKLKISKKDKKKFIKIKIPKINFKY